MNVYLDGKYAFALDAALAAALKVGQVLPPNDQAVLGQRDAVEVAYNKVLGFLSYRPRSGAEVATYLRGRQVPAEIITSPDSPGKYSFVVSLIDTAQQTFAFWF